VKPRALLYVVLVAACGDDESVGPSPPAAEVLVSPGLDTLRTGETMVLAAIAISASGDTLSGHTVYWTSSDPDVAGVSSEGMVTGHRTGTVAIRATVEEVTGSASLRVESRFKARAVELESIRACAIGMDDRIRCWGSDVGPYGGSYGWLGQGELGADFLAHPTLIATSTTFAVLGEGMPWCALTPAGAAWCWGSGGFSSASQPPDGRGTPEPLPGGVVFTRLSGGCGLSAGTVYCWDTNALPRPTPMPAWSTASGFTDFDSEIFAPFFDDTYCGIDAGAALWCWGSNYQGQVGDGTIWNNRDEPVPIGAGTSFDLVRVGDASTCALALGGRPYCWGENESGQVGDGTTVQRLVPTPVAGDLRLTELDVGYRHVCGLDADGVAWCWGRNTNGELGTGDQTDRHQPTVVATDLRFRTIRAGWNRTCAISLDDEVYCWGLPFGPGSVLPPRLRPVPVLTEGE
jgi:hypothetical protein